MCPLARFSLFWYSLRMSLNWKEINVILEELDITDAYIQAIVQPGFDSIALYTYKNSIAKTVYISLAPGACRINETRKKIPKNEKPLRFMEFLKKRIKGGKIIRAVQLEKQRIIKLEILVAGDLFFMFIRLWSGAANIVVTDVNLTVLDVFFRRPKRNEISGGKFSLPEPREIDSSKDEAFCIRSFDDLIQPDNSKELSFNEKVELWYSDHSQVLSREALLEQAKKLYTVRKSRMQKALKKLESKRIEFLEADSWKHFGDLILAYGHAIKPDLQVLVCTDYETDNEVSIPIDPKKRVQENAQSYYDKYKKAVSGIEDLEFDIKKAKNEISKLDADYELVVNEQNPIAIQQLIRKQNKPKQQLKKEHPGLVYEIDGWRILVGRTAGENDELLRRHVKGFDMWLHTRDWAGGYVFIKNRPGKTIPLEILLYAGNLAVYYSKARKAQNADLYYTQVKHLRRAKNAPKGTVLPANEKNLTISLDQERLRHMETCQKL